MAKGKIIGIISLKGGVGKTSVVANLGSTFATQFKKKVLVVDANFSTPHLGIHFGCIQPGLSLHHVLSGQALSTQAIYEHPSGTHIMPGSLSPWQVNPLALKDALNPLKEHYDFILLDSSPSLNDEMFATMAASDELVVVSSPDYPTLTATLQAIRLAKNKQSPIRGIIINKVRGKKFELTSKDIQSTSDCEVLGTIPDDFKVLEALSAMTPVATYSPKREVSKAFTKISSKLIGENQENSSIIKKTKKILNSLVNKDETQL